MIFKILFPIFVIILSQTMFIFIATLLFMQYDLVLRKTEAHLQKTIHEAKQEFLLNCEYYESRFNIY